MLKKSLYIAGGLIFTIAVSLFIKTYAVYNEYEIEVPVDKSIGDKACYIQDLSHFTSIDRNSLKAHDNFVLMTKERAVDLKLSCHPMIYNEQGIEKDACQIGYFFNKGIPTVYYVGPTIDSVESRSLYKNCTPMLNNLKKDYPNTVIVPAAQKNIKILQQYYYD